MQEAGVEYAELNHLYTAHSELFTPPDDTLYDQQWAHQNTQAEEAWEIETGDANPVIVAVIEGGDVVIFPST